MPTRPAATVMLMRRGGKHREVGLELLMLKRGDAAKFMPGVWVFAGGIVDREDFEAAERAPLAAAGDESNPGATAARPEDVDPDEWAHRICGARELAEEAAVEVAPGDLVPWSRWITPEMIPKRYDTRFYVALAPPHSKPEPDGVEMDEARWITPQEALRASAADELEISFPTIRHLETMVDLSSADEVLAAAATRKVEPILPKVIGTPEAFRVVVPGEPGYPED